MEAITSPHNPRIKNLLLLQEKSRARREQGLFVVEGRRELEHCIEAGFQIDSLFVCPEIADDEIRSALGLGMTQPSVSHPAPTLSQPGPTLSDPACSLSHRACSLSHRACSLSDPASSLSYRASSLSDPASSLSYRASSLSDPASSLSYRALASVSPVITLPEPLYRKVAYRESTEGIIAIVKYKSLTLEDLHLPENPLIMVLEAVEKPGNLGAVLRSADAAHADAVLVCDPLTDLYNPNLIRASIGAVFTVPTVACTSEEAIAFLKAHDIQILTAQLQDSSLYYDVDMKRGTALVMGTESTGLTPVWRKAASAHIRIPMLGRLDSLNVSVSAAILLYEAVRQRQG